MNVLLLPSWYPTVIDRVNGIFVRRHAKAVALKHHVVVAYVKRNDAQDEVFELSHHEEANLKEHICYYKGSNTVLIRHILNAYRYLLAWHKAIAHALNGFHPNLIHINVVWPVGLIYLMKPILHKLPLHITEHWSGYLDADGQFNRQIINRWVSRKVFRKAFSVSVISNLHRDAIIRHGLHKNVTLISNVVEDCFKYNQAEKADRLTFLHVSSLVEREKNIRKMLEGFALFCKTHMAKARLIIVGGESRIDNFQEDIKRWSSSDAEIQYIGNQSSESIAELMNTADALLLPSHFEGQPVVVLEALCCGLPVIASATGAIPDCVNMYNGILMSHNDASNIAESLKKFVLRQHDFDRKAIAQQAKSLYSPEQIAEDFDFIFCEMFQNQTWKEAL